MIPSLYKASLLVFSICSFLLFPVAPAQELAYCVGGEDVDAIGEACYIGIVFNVYDNGKYRLIAVTVDQSPSVGIRWTWCWFTLIA